MKQKLQKKHKKGYLTRLLGLAAALVFALGAAVYSPAQPSGAASISELQKKAQQLRDEIAANQKIAAEHHARAESLKDKINEINAEIAVVNQQIELLSLQIEELKLKIEETNRELERQRNVLGANIRVMYFEGDVSTIEMLAYSQNLSEFVDREQYRISVQAKIKNTMDTIKELKAELDA